jgi:hypothetical protein
VPETIFVRAYVVWRNPRRCMVGGMVGVFDRCFAARRISGSGTLTAGRYYRLSLGLSRMASGIEVVALTEECRIPMLMSLRAEATSRRVSSALTTLLLLR